MIDLGRKIAEIAALKHAIPYIRMFKGRTFVIKVGGEAVADASLAKAFVAQVDILHHLGIRVVVVHGGGAQLTAAAAALGGETRYVRGRRVTDERSLEAAIMVLNGEVNTRILAACRAAGLPALGLSGVDAGLIRARRRPPVTVEGELVDYGFVGDIAGVEPGPLETVLQAGFVPVVSPIAADDAGTVLNINADTVASALAIAMKAEKLILMTGAPGILEDPADPRSLVSYTDLVGLDRLRAQGSVDRGMLPKTDAIEAALRGGVRRVNIVSHAVADSLLIEVFTNEGIGTLIVEDIHALSPSEQTLGAGSNGSR